MRIFYFDSLTTIIICFVLWAVLGLVAMEITFLIPDSFYRVDNWMFKTYAWEKDGVIYEKLFKVKKWKHLLPDGARYVKRGYRKKNLQDSSKENLELFVLETCRAELTHVLGALPFWVFGFFIEPEGVLIMLGYAIIANLPCILVQRYNRIRLTKILAKKKKAVPGL